MLNERTQTRPESMYDAVLFMLSWRSKYKQISLGMEVNIIATLGEITGEKGHKVSEMFIKKIIYLEVRMAEREEQEGREPASLRPQVAEPVRSGTG